MNEIGKVFLQSNDIGDTKIDSLSVLLPISTTELAEFDSYDTDDATKSRIEEIAERWDELWPQINGAFLEGVESYGTDQRIGGPGFGGFFVFCADDGSKLDCDFSIGFQMSDDVPGWDFSITDWKVEGYQAVY